MRAGGRAAAGTEPIAAPGSLQFVVLCLGRTGSSHLVELLDSHPRIRCFGEILNTRFPKASAEAAFTDSDATLPEQHAHEVLASRPDAAAVGFKLPHNSIREHPAMAALLDATPSLRIVRLSRANHLDLFVSRRMLRRTLVARSTDGSYGEATIHLDPAECLVALQHIEAEQHEIDALGRGCPSHPVSYEALAAGDPLAGLQRFLGVEPRELSSPERRLRIRPLRETIENWEEVRDRVAGSRFAGFLPSD